MSTNKSALIRYKTIDQCLRNRFRKWTLNDLIEKAADALYDYEGISTGISKRTIQADIQTMRSDKLGYNAPIVVIDRKFYTYSDPDYNIHQSPITDDDMEKMQEIVDLLKHLNGFSHFEDMSDLIARLDNTFQKTNEGSNNFIQLESNKQLKGLNWITPLYQAIRQQIPLLIQYKSFKSIQSTKTVYYPYLLKEYRNRWFLIAKPRNGTILITLALDRMEEVLEMSANDFVPYDGVDFDRYYSDVIGVTKTIKDRAQKVILWINPQTAPYVLTKPIHHSQQLISENKERLLIRLDVVLNFEFEREILGFGDNIKVISPQKLRNRIKARLGQAVNLYE